VEDNPLLMSIVCAGIGVYETSILEANDQLMAINLFCVSKPEVVISDIQMRVGDTRDFLQLVSESESSKVLIFSSDSDLLFEVEGKYRELGWYFVNKNDKFWLRQFGEVVKRIYAMPNYNNYSK